MKKTMLMVLAVGVIGMMAGCGTMTFTSLDPVTGQICKIENFNGDLSTAILFELHNKINIDATSGRLIKLQVEPPSKENPTGTITIEYADGSRVHITIPKDSTVTPKMLEAIAKIIEASTGKNVAVSTSGVTSANPVMK